MFEFVLILYSVCFRLIEASEESDSSLERKQSHKKKKKRTKRRERWVWRMNGELDGTITHACFWLLRNVQYKALVWSWHALLCVVAQSRPPPLPNVGRRRLKRRKRKKGDLLQLQNFFFLPSANLSGENSVRQTTIISVTAADRLPVILFIKLHVSVFPLQPMQSYLCLGTIPYC